MPTSPAPCVWSTSTVGTARWPRPRSRPSATSAGASRDEREEEATAVQWTLWGKQAENAAEYLGKGSHVNIVGRLRNNNYQDASGADVYALSFTCEEIDYLDSKEEAEARRMRQEPSQPAPAKSTPPRKTAERARA
jgi:single-strand DNA-binding protein